VKALEAQGAEVTFLCRSSFDVPRVPASEIQAILPSGGAGTGSAPIRALRRIRDARAVAETAVREAASGDYDGLLIACYSEYFSPFWASIFQRAARKALKIGTIAHDPVRDFVLGPLWWHRWSVRQAYSFVSHVFVHDMTPVDFGSPPAEHLTCHVIPHGPLEACAPRMGRAAMRNRYGFAERDRVFLFFGQIRNGKNLDRFLRVMRELPIEVKLLVAGSGGGGSQRPPENYRQLAVELGVLDRCVFDFRYIPDEETGDLFAAADAVLMTYSAKFRSASGVLNTAVACRKPVLASSGAGPLRTAVDVYRLGSLIVPDDDAAILQGALQLIAEPGEPQWERYEKENSWEANARGILKAFSQ
jgi:glycosyltransferase involved in cell wall biosynthesis